MGRIEPQRSPIVGKRQPTQIKLLPNVTTMEISVSTIWRAQHPHMEILHREVVFTRLRITKPSTLQRFQSASDLKQ